MKIARLIFFLVVISGCSKFPQKIKYYDSVYIRNDTIRVTTPSGTFDTIKYHKTKITSSKSNRVHFRVDLIIAAALALLIIFIKFKH